MTAIVQTRPEPVPPRLAPAELAAQDIELLPDRETLCGWHCNPCHFCQPCHPIVYCAPKWCNG